MVTRIEKNFLDACIHGNIKAVKNYIKKGIDVNCKHDFDGKTALMLTGKNEECIEIVNLLIEAGADVNAQNDDGQNALKHAVIQKYTKTVMLLIKNKNINIQNINGALFIACFLGHAEIVSALIDAGADINAKDKNNNTPLMIAKLKNKKEVVQLLQQTKLFKKVIDNYVFSI